MKSITRCEECYWARGVVTGCEECYWVLLGEELLPGVTRCEERYWAKNFKSKIWCIASSSLHNLIWHVNAIFVQNCAE